jgi:hypothetical protein
MMDNYLIPACIVLILTNITFAALANSWRNKANQYASANIKVAVRAMRAENEAHASAFTAGLKQGVGGMYRSALMASDDDALFAALRATGRWLLNDPSAFEEESIVQVPEVA